MQAIVTSHASSLARLASFRYMYSGCLLSPSPHPHRFISYVLATSYFITTAPSLHRLDSSTSGAWVTDRHHTALTRALHATGHFDTDLLPPQSSWIPAVGIARHRRRARAIDSGSVTLVSLLTSLLSALSDGNISSSLPPTLELKSYATFHHSRTLSVISHDRNAFASIVKALLLKCPTVPSLSGTPAVACCAAKRTDLFSYGMSMLVLHQETVEANEAGAIVETASSFGITQSNS